MQLDYPGPDDASIQGQWAALEEMQAAKLTRSIAVSNYNARQLDAVSETKSGSRHRSSPTQTLVSKRLLPSPESTVGADDSSSEGALRRMGAGSSVAGSPACGHLASHI